MIKLVCGENWRKTVYLLYQIIKKSIFALEYNSFVDMSVLELFKFSTRPKYFDRSQKYLFNIILIPVKTIETFFRSI